MKTTRLRVQLRDVEPAVVRVIDVPAKATLPEVHQLLQVALGWTDSHLHVFETGEASYGIPDEDAPDDEVDETGVRLTVLPPRFVYRYDFGDDWEHDIEVLGAGAERPGCVYGEGPCPPEDCGGPGGYDRLRAVLADPAHPDHSMMRQWAGELPDFDQDDADRLVRQTVGEVPASVRMLLDMLAPGIKLTPGGRLPRAFVREVQQQRPDWYWHGSQRPANREEDLLPLYVLHDLLRRVKLLRMRSGVLAPTKAATDDLEILRRLRTWFGRGHIDSVLTDAAVAAILATGPQKVDHLARVIAPQLGYSWVTAEGQPITDGDVRMELYRLAAALRALDLIETEPAGIGTWHPGPAATSLLPRAIALAHIWNRNPVEAN